MNFIKLYIGDYMRDTGTLTVAEHGAYVLMLLHHYGTERPLPQGRELHRLLRAESKADRDAIDSVVKRFWQVTEEGLVNNRAGKEMQRAEHQREVNRTVGALGGRPKRKETESVSESEPNGNRTQTLTRHQTPDTTPTVVGGGAGGVASPDDQPPEAPAPAAAAAATRRGSRLPQDWALPKAWGEWAMAEFPQWSPAKVRLEADRFRDHWHAASGKAGTKADWLATWRNWCRSDIAHRDDARTGAAQAVEQQADRRAEETAAYLAEQARHAAQAVPPPPEVRKRLAELAGRMTAVVAEGGTR